MDLKRSRKAAEILLIVAGTLVALGAFPEEKKLLDVRVPAFEYHGNSPSRGHLATPLPPPGDLPEAALNLANHAHVRIAIEGLAKPSGRAVDIKASNATVKEILDRLIAQDPSYEYQERLGVIEVRPVGALADPTDCLNMVIPSFHLHYPYSMAWAQILCEVRIIAHDPTDIVPDPLAAGRCWGASHMVAPPPHVLGVTFDHRPVRDILDVVTSMAGNVCWHVYSKISAPDCGKLEHGVGESSPTTMYPVEGTSPPRYTEKMPRECYRCHYHQQLPMHTAPVSILPEGK